MSILKEIEIDTHLKSLNLLQEIEALAREAKSKLPSPFCRDPYHRRARKYPRGGTRARSERRLAAYEATKKVINAQQEIEATLRANGKTWRDLEKLVHREYGGVWFAGIAPASRRLLNVA